MLFTGGSALSQDEGEGWDACAEHPLCKQGLTLQLSQHRHQVEIKYSPGTSPVLGFSLLLVTVELRTFP